LQDSAGLYYRVGGGSPGGGGGVTDHGALTGLTDDDHPQYILGAGDAMTGQLGLVAPTIGTNAARWVDGRPSFANGTERDAAYASAGGPVIGMECFLRDRDYSCVFSGTKWYATHYFGCVSRLADTALSAGVTYNTVWDTLAFTPMAGTAAMVTSASGITVARPGLYMIDSVVVLAGTGTAGNPSEYTMYTKKNGVVDATAIQTWQGSGNRRFMTIMRGGDGDLINLVINAKVATTMTEIILFVWGPFR